MKIAAIDIGSNAVRLLVKDTGIKDFMLHLHSIGPTDYYQRIPLKSGTDAYADGNISKKTSLLLLAAIRHFADVIKKLDVKDYRACATAAYRDAKNGREIIQQVAHICGLNIEVISGKEESRLTKLSFILPKKWKNDYLLFADVGGGSTEISIMRGEQSISSNSYQVGSMRYACHKQSATQEAALFDNINQIYSLYAPLHYIGVGGCVSFICNYLNNGSAHNIIHVESMQQMYNQLAALTIDQIVETYHIPHERADILTPACSIFLRIANTIKATEIYVPAIGVRNGIITELYNKETA